MKNDLIGKINISLDLKEVADYSMIIIQGSNLEKI